MTFEQWCETEATKLLNIDMLTKAEKCLIKIGWDAGYKQGAEEYAPSPVFKETRSPYWPKGMK